MSEITWLDGKILRPLFRILRKTYVGTPIVLLALKGMDIFANGVHSQGRYGTRFGWRKFRRLVLVGQSHLDAAWRWRTKQGIMKAKGTFKKAIGHIETVPEFTFAQPSPCYYQWMKDHYPKLYSQIKQDVAMGRFIPIGGSWVESDTNIPDGESLVRQRLYGQRFYLQEFNLLSDVEVLQDCFGFNWNLPQIYKKSGAKMFATGKLFWNKTTKIPIGMCHWEAPDGTRLPMFHLHFGYFLPITYGKDYPLIYLLGKPGETLIANYRTPQKNFAQWRSREYMMETIFAYGLGDGGHGPIEVEILVASIMRRLWPKKMKFYQQGDFFKLFQKYFPRWAIWKDEWYLDYHRGTYTSVSRVKRGNRESEIRLESAEMLSTYASILGLPSIRGELESHWKIHLYNQFHDILPGSSIPEVYLDYNKDFSQVLQFTKHIIKESFRYIGSKTNFEDYGNPILFFNPISWERTGILEVLLPDNDNYEFFDSKNQPLFSQLMGYEGGSIDPDWYRKRYLIALNQIPSMGLGIIYCRKAVKTKNTKATDNTLTIQEQNQIITLENKYLKVEIDRSTGLIYQIFAKENGKMTPFLQEPSGKLLIFEEKDHTDAWNIDPKYPNYPLKYDLTPQSVNIIETGPVRITVEILRKIKDSTFIQRIGLGINSDIVFNSYDIDLQNPNLLCKLLFNVNIQSELVTAEIPYAYIDRSIKPITILDKSRWEQACQKWISISNGVKAFTIINNGKYGYNAIPSDNGTFLQPTVVRSPKYTGYAKETMFVNRSNDGGLDPNMPKFTDLELHRDIHFDIYVHGKNWHDKAWQKAYEVNFPFLCELIHPTKGEKTTSNSIGLPLSLITIEPDSVQCSVVKVAEDEKDLQNPLQFILRLVERKGQETSTKISFNSLLKLQKIETVDLLELNAQPIIQMTPNSFVLTIHPYEILTLRIHRTK